MNRYACSELFVSLQGEGALVGTPAVFLRLAGCNMGRIEGRGACSSLCDTDYSLRFTESTEGLGRRIGELVKSNPGVRMVVVTGGEPLLQLDAELVNELNLHVARVQVETNGTVPMYPAIVEWETDINRKSLFVTCSPKNLDEFRLDVPMDELKVLFPVMDPCKALAVVRKVSPFAPRHLFVQPVWDNRRALEQAARYCLENPGWRLSVQTHKFIGVR